MLFFRCIAFLLVALSPLVATQGSAQAPERRFALVVGNSEYKAGRLPTAANDAGLIAQTLRSAGFDVSGARDLDQDTLRRSMREFLDKVTAAGPQAVTFVYLAGYGVQFDGENYILPVDAIINRDEDIPIEAIRISDLTRPLSGAPGAVKFFIVDAARQHPFTPVGAPLASGLALIEPDPGLLIAFNAAPGSIAPIENGPYGAFAQSLAEMISLGGLGLDDLFARVRLRVNEKTNGLAVPWYASKITQPFLFMERTPDAPAPPNAMALADVETRPMSDFGADREAYAAALARDTLRGYEEFVAVFPDSPLAARVRALMAVRREAITWRRTLSINTPEAYWSYLERYPQGAHVPDAERRLARLAAAYDPPPAFMPMVYDIPPPPPDEVVYLTQPEIVFDGPGFLPPPPIPAFFLPPPPPEFIVLAPPPPPIGAFFLPMPVVPFIVERTWAQPPAFVQPPPAVPLQRINVNNTTIININQQAGGRGATPVSAALPAAVVTRVNSGALKPPPPAPPPPAPIHQTAALTGTGSLGKSTPPPPPHAGPTTITKTPVPPQGSTTPNSPRPTGPNTATITPGVPPPGAPLPGAPRPSGFNPTMAVPGAPPTGLRPPESARPIGPNTATTTPGVPPRLTAPPGGVHPTGITAPIAAPTAPPTGAPHPGGLHPPSGNTATTTFGSLPKPGSPPGSAHPSRPNTATAVPGVPSPSKSPSPSAPRSATPSRATTVPPGPAAAPPAPKATQINRPVASPAPPPLRVPQMVSRPPPPPPVVHTPPPAPVAHPPSLPPVAHPPVASPPPRAAAASPAPKKCVVENGKQVCR